MRIRLLLLMVAATYGGYQWWQGREPPDDVAISQDGFVPVEMPGGARRDTVLVLAPRNCPSEQARRSEALVEELQRAGIPVVRGDSFFFDIENPSEEQVAGIQRAMAVFRQGAPAVYFNGRAMSNPDAALTIAEYRASTSGP